jgi:hypothetical protein
MAVAAATEAHSLHCDGAGDHGGGGEREEGSRQVLDLLGFAGDCLKQQPAACSRRAGGGGGGGGGVKHLLGSGSAGDTWLCR